MQFMYGKFSLSARVGSRSGPTTWSISSCPHFWALNRVVISSMQMRVGHAHSGLMIIARKKNSSAEVDVSAPAAAKLAAVQFVWQIISGSFTSEPSVPSRARLRNDGITIFSSCKQLITRMKYSEASDGLWACSISQWSQRIPGRPCV